MMWLCLQIASCLQIHLAAYKRDLQSGNRTIILCWPLSHGRDIVVGIVATLATLEPIAARTTAEPRRPGLGVDDDEVSQPPPEGTQATTCPQPRPRDPDHALPGLR